MFEHYEDIKTVPSPTARKYAKIGEAAALANLAVLERGLKHEGQISEICSPYFCCRRRNDSYYRTGEQKFPGHDYYFVWTWKLYPHNGMQDIYGVWEGHCIDVFAYCLDVNVFQDDDTLAKSNALSSTIFLYGEESNEKRYNRIDYNWGETCYFNNQTYPRAMQKLIHILNFARRTQWFIQQYPKGIKESS